MNTNIEKVFNSNKNILLSYDWADELSEYFSKNGNIIHKVLCDAEIANVNDAIYSSFIKNFDFMKLEQYLSSIRYDIVILSSNLLAEYIPKQKEFITEFIRPKLKLGGSLFMELKKDMEFLKTILHEIDAYCLVDRVFYNNNECTLGILCTYWGEKVSEFFRGCPYRFFLAGSEISFKINPHFGPSQSTCLKGLVPIGELNLTIPLFVFDFLLEALPLADLQQKDIACFSDVYKQPRYEEELYDDVGVDEFYKKNKYGLYIKDEYFSNDFKKIEENAYRYSSQLLSKPNSEEKGSLLLRAYVSGRYIVINIHNLTVAAFIVGTTLYLPEDKANDYKFFKLQDDCIKNSDELIAWACLIAKFFKEKGLSVSFGLTSDDIKRIVLNIMYPKEKVGKLGSEFKLLYSKQKLEDYPEFRKTLNEWEKKKLIIKEYDRFFWDEQRLKQYVNSKIKKHELGNYACLGIVYNFLENKASGKRDKRNEKLVEKLIPCGRKIADAIKEVKENEKVKKNKLFDLFEEKEEFKA